MRKSDIRELYQLLRKKFKESDGCPVLQILRGSLSLLTLLEDIRLCGDTLALDQFDSSIPIKRINYYMESAEDVSIDIPGATLTIIFM